MIKNNLDISMTDFIYKVINQMEKDVVSFYPNKKDQIGELHFLLFALGVHHSLLDGIMPKEALLDFIDEYSDYCSKEVDEINEGKSYAH